MRDYPGAGNHTDSVSSAVSDGSAGFAGRRAGTQGSSALWGGL